MKLVGMDPLKLELLRSRDCRAVRPEISGTDPLIRGFCARTKESRLPDQAPVLHAAGTVPDRPAAVKSTCWTALRPARSDRLPTLQLPWKMLGPSWEIITEVTLPLVQRSPVQGTGLELSPQGLLDDVPVGVDGVGGDAGRVGVLYVGVVGVVGVVEVVVGVVGVHGMADEIAAA